MNDDSRRLVALSVYHYVNDGSLTLFASALPVMRISLGLSLVEIGTVLSLGLVATMLLQLLFGSLSDRGHVRWVLIAGFAGVVAADLVFPASTSFMHVLVAYVFLRSAAAVYHPVSFSSIGRAYGEDRTAAFGYQGAVGDLGLTIATFSTGVLSQMWDWRSPFWVWGMVGLMLFAYFAATIFRRKIGFHVHSVASTSEAVNLRQNLSVRSVFAVLAAGSSVVTATFILFTGYMPLYFNVAEQLSPGASTTMVAAWIGIGVFAGFVTGRLVMRFGGETKTLRAMFATEFLLFLIAYMTTFQTPTQSCWRVVRSAAIVLTGIPVFVTFPAINGLLGLRMPHERLGLAYAINLSLGLMAASLVTYFTGYFASIMTLGVMLPLLVVFAAVGSVISLML